MHISAKEQQEVVRLLHNPPRRGKGWVDLSYICIPNRSKICSYAKAWKTVGNFAKYGVQLQATDCHTIRQTQAFLCKNQDTVSVQKGGLRTANKAYLHCKQALLDARKHLNCHANKASLQCKEALFGNRTPFLSAAKRLHPCFHDQAGLLEREFPLSKIFTALHYICMCCPVKGRVQEMTDLLCAKILKKY